MKKFTFFWEFIVLLDKDSTRFSIDAKQAILYNWFHMAKILSKRVGVRRFSPERDIVRAG